MPSHRLISETVESSQRQQMIDVTQRIEKHIAAAGVKEGIVLVFVPHTTAGVIVQENADPATKHDLLKKLETLVPQNESYYEHDEGNSDSHVKTACVGNSVMVPITNGKMALGRWQAIYFIDFDGPRERRMMVKLMQDG